MADMTQERVADIAGEVETAMVMALYEVVMGNIGQSFGVDRPKEWAPLSEAYAKRVGRDYATLEVTGALRAAVKMETGAGKSSVSISDDDCPYASVHQWGSKGGVTRRSKRGRFMSNAFSQQGSLMPERPYFPVDENGEVTPFTKEYVEAAGLEELSKQTLRM